MAPQNLEIDEWPPILKKLWVIQIFEKLQMNLNMISKNYEWPMKNFWEWMDDKNFFEKIMDGPRFQNSWMPPDKFLKIYDWPFKGAQMNPEFLISWIALRRRRQDNNTNIRLRDHG